MNQEELDEEYRYRYEERLGILCGSGVPSIDDMRIAASEAQQVVDDLKGRNE